MVSKSVPLPLVDKKNSWPTGGVTGALQENHTVDTVAATGDDSPTASVASRWEKDASEPPPFASDARASADVTSSLVGGVTGNVAHTGPGAEGGLSFRAMKAQDTTTLGHPSEWEVREAHNK